MNEAAIDSAQSCSCAACIKCCTKGNPGWFAPGEAESAARLLGMTFEEFKREFLIVDYWIGDHDEIDVLAPRKVEIETHRVRASWGYTFHSGRCVFLTEENRCNIHQAKPLECRETFGCDKGQGRSREDISKMWAGAALAHPADTNSQEIDLEAHERDLESRSGCGTP